MSNHVVSVSAIPNSIPSGTATQVDIEYESDDGGPVQITTGGGFTVSPASVQLAVSPAATHGVQLTITRGNATTRSCRLVFHFFSSSRELLVQIT